MKQQKGERKVKVYYQNGGFMSRLYGLIKKLTIFVLLLSLVIGGVIVYIRSPGPSGFGWHSTVKDVVPPGLDLANKNIIVTGGYSGIGVPTVEVLAELGANIWLPTRPSSIQICERIVKSIIEKSKNPRIFCEEMDLSSLRSVQSFANKWKKDNKALHVLINNAGIMGCPYAESVDGFELQFATNHLGHFLLTKLLMPNLVAGKPSRVVVVSSEAHRMGGLDFDDLKGKESWYNGTGVLAQYFGPWRAYGQSKSANILFSLALNKRMAGFGTSNALHPGAILATNLKKYAPFIDLIARVESYVEALFFKTIPQGAATQVFLAVSPTVEGYGGNYYSDSNQQLPAWWAADPVLAEKLWDLSEQYTAAYH